MKRFSAHEPAARPTRETPAEKRGQRGMTFFEVIVVMAVLAIISAIGVSFASSWVRRERMRSAAFVIQTHMQMARVEAMSRNRDCRFTIDTSNNEVKVIDLMDPANNADDVEITTTLLPVEIDFDRPDTGSAITLNNLSGTVWETTFQQDGVVSSGSGDVFIATDEAYKRVSVYVAGGVHMRSWRAGGWAEGS